jgi:hypothetical protein
MHSVCLIMSSSESGHFVLAPRQHLNRLSTFILCGRLGAFINKVDGDERHDDDTLTTDQADELRTQAEEIRDVLLLGC